MDEPEGAWRVRWRLGLLFVSGNSISIILIDRIFCNFDRLKNPNQNADLTCQHIRTNITKKYSITKQNSAKLGINISEEVTCLILI